MKRDGYFIFHTVKLQYGVWLWMAGQHMRTERESIELVRGSVDWGCALRWNVATSSKKWHCLAIYLASSDTTYHSVCHLSLCTANTQYRKFETNIPRKGIARPQSQFPHIHVSVSGLYIPTIGLPILLQENMWTDPGIYTVNRSQTHECGNWGLRPGNFFSGNK